MHLISWEAVCKPKELGGLGIRQLKPWSSALMAKHAARAVIDPNNLWSRLVREKYYFDNWRSYRIPSRCSAAWRAIVREAGNIVEHLRIVVGTGKNIGIVNDPWIGTTPLSSWPTLVNIEAVEDEMKDALTYLLL